MSCKPRFLISACLCGRMCRYDAVKLNFPRLEELAASGLALPVCPEELGGLPTPRTPCEILRGRVFTQDGKDLTDTFRRGAFQILDLARKYNIQTAILKDRSPSCGTTRIYDGSFAGRLIPGQGVAAAVLRLNGFTLYNESNVPECFSIDDARPDFLSGADAGRPGPRPSAPALRAGPDSAILRNCRSRGESLR